MLLTAITFFILLSVLVLVHELGHFLAARLIGVHVDEFGFGLPPRIIGKKIRGTIYSLNWLPIGGFVRLLGEDEEDNQPHGSIKNKKQYFWARSKKERIFILLAGVAMNFLFAVGITTILLTWGVIEPTETVRVERVVVGSPAEAVGILPGDIVRTLTVMETGGVKDIAITNPDILIASVKAHAGQMVLVSLIRDGQPLKLNAIPRTNPPEGEGALGIAISNLEKHIYPWWEAPPRAFVITGERLFFMVKSLGAILFKLVTGGRIESGAVAGPVGIAQATSIAVKYGLETILEFAGILSLNLTLVNVIPFPALDGGRIAFVVFEKLGRKARPDIERTIHQIGMMFLLGLLLLITLSDIMRIVRG